MPVRRIPVALACALTVGACGAPETPVAETAPSKESSSTRDWTSLGARNRGSTGNRVIHSNSNAQWVDYDPPIEHPGGVTEYGILVTMDDGVALSLNVTRPADASGAPVPGPLPTLVTFTPYNKNVGDTVPLGGAVNPYFVGHGYNQVFVDVRGTGRSHGSWDPFSAREQQDYPQVLDWVVQQPWSNGVIGMWGLSATATTAMLAAAQGHPAIKAVFPIVPMGDVYRDVVFVGGQASIAFLPAWLSVVTLIAVTDPRFYEQPDQYLAAALEHAAGSSEFLVPRTAGVFTGQPDTIYDNAYWGDKSPLESAPGLRVPTFIVGGLYDIFQRSEPLNYEALKHQATTKLLMGPWDHLQAAVGEGLPMDGVPPLDRIALMWFDRYLKDIANGAEDLPNVTQWVWGHEHFQTVSDWPHPQARAQRLYLNSAGTLDDAPPAAGTVPSLVVQQPVNGVCSEATLQISLGLMGNVPLPCWYEDNAAQTLEVTFETPAFGEDVYINGPIQADLWISTTALDAGLAVRVSDLAEDGTAHSLTHGLQTASLRAVDESKSRYLGGEMIQPWHPFTEESVQPLAPNEIVKVPVEVQQTSALIRKGHRLRVSVGASSFPYGMMPPPALAQGLAGLLSVHGAAASPSSVVLPAVPVAELDGR